MKKSIKKQHNNLQDNHTLELRHAEFFSGPLPHPDQFLKYEQVCPGAAKDIISMAVAQAGHRQSLERMALDSKIQNERRGMDYAFAISCIVLIGGFILVLFNKNIAGYATLISTAVFLVGSFVYKKADEKKRVEKLQARD